MEIKDLTFIEQYLYEEPKENYHRGLSVEIDDVCLLDWKLEFNQEPVTDKEIEEEKNNPNFWISKPRAVLVLFNHEIPRNFLSNSIKNNIEFGTKRMFLLEDIDKAKEESLKKS